ncbi:LysR family transcriptional regulator [Mesorhizobium sp. f-mel]
MENLRSLPLPTLRTFKAAARHQSLTKAANELHLTDSASDSTVGRGSGLRAFCQSRAWSDPERCKKNLR